MSDAPDQVRKRLRNQTRRGNDKTATETMKGLKYAVPKNPGDLSERQSGALETPRDTDPRDQPTGHGNSRNSQDAPAPTRRTSRSRIGTMDLPGSHSRIPEIVELCRKTRRRKDDIPKTIRLGHSNARPEAFNNKIKATIRMAYGFRHVDNLIAMIKTPMQRPTHPPTNTHPPTHENSRRLIFLNGSCEDVDPKSWLQRKVAYHGIWESGKIWQIMLTD